MAHRAVSGLVTIVLVLATVAAGAALSPAAAYQHRDWGKTWTWDRELKPRCHDYTFRYNLDPPRGQWMIESILVDPDGEKIAHTGALKGTDPKKGKLSFRICKPNTRPGTFKIKTKMSIRRGETTKKGWIKPFYFKLT